MESVAKDTINYYALWKSVETILELLRTRGYTIPEEFKMSKEAFREWCGENTLSQIMEDMTLIISRKDRPSSSVAIVWRVNLGVSDIQNITENMRGEKVAHAIIIYKTKITSYASAALRMLKQQNITIETFTEAELQYDVKMHVDVPRHIICSNAKKEEILKVYAVTKDQLPKISPTDINARYLGATKGQLIKIVRPSESISDVMINGEKKQLVDITYRIVG